MNTQKLKPEEYDLLVLGSGEAGKFLAWTLAKKGMKAAVIERKYVGGSCPNIACLPSKNIIQSAKVASYFQRSEEFGITKNSWNIRMPAVRERKRKMVSGLVDMHLDFYKKSGTELIMGSGSFVGPKTIEVNSPEHGARLLHGEKIIINTGTRATIDPTPGLAQSNPLTHIETLELDYVPQQEIMAAVQVAMIAGFPYTALRDAIFTHPTLLEGLIPLFTARFVPPPKALVSHA
jgi:pyruvate/2-oxoglutarate dehydrogenase complex dihydrolipoamide dehydrogenase (E3) component